MAQNNSKKINHRTIPWIKDKIFFFYFFHLKTNIFIKYSLLKLLIFTSQNDFGKKQKGNWPFFSHSFRGPGRFIRECWSERQELLLNVPVTYGRWWSIAAPKGFRCLFISTPFLLGEQPTPPWRFWGRLGPRSSRRRQTLSLVFRSSSAFFIYIAGEPIFRSYSDNFLSGLQISLISPNPKMAAFLIQTGRRRIYEEILSGIGVLCCCYGFGIWGGQRKFWFLWFCFFGLFSGLQIFGGSSDKSWFWRIVKHVVNFGLDPSEILVTEDQVLLRNLTNFVYSGFQVLWIRYCTNGSSLRWKSRPPNYCTRTWRRISCIWGSTKVNVELSFFYDHRVVARMLFA